MRILLISPRYYPEPFAITKIAESMVQLGHEVVVYTGRPNYGLWKIYDGYENVKHETINGVQVNRLKEWPRKKGFFGLLYNYLSIFKIYRRGLRKIKGQFDIVISHMMSPILALDYVGEYCRKTKTPHLMYGFDLWPESLIAAGYVKSRSSLIVRMLKPYCKRIYSDCDLITFTSPSAEKYFRDYLSINTPFAHIYQPCLTKVPDEIAVCNHEYYKNGKLHILFCGTIARFTRLDLFIKAIKNSKHNESIIFDIVGSGSDMDRIRRLVKKLKMENQVIFHGRVKPDNTVDFYKNSDVLFVPLFCNSATSLMIPQKLIEYFMYSRPIIGMIQGDGRNLLESASKLNVVCDQTIASLQNGVEKIASFQNNELLRCGTENRYFFMNNKRFSLECVVNELLNYSLALIKKEK